MARLQAQCRVDRRAAESLRGRPITRSRRRQVGLAVSAALVAAVAAANPAQAAIEIDHGIEFVNVTDVPENTPLLLTVTAPNGATIGSKAFTTATGAYEVNHTGAADGDCWDGATSPDCVRRHPRRVRQHRHDAPELSGGGRELRRPLRCRCPR